MTIKYYNSEFLANLVMPWTEHVTIRSYDERGNSFDKKRKATKAERKILASVLSGAMRSLNWVAMSSTEDDFKIKIQQTKDTAEFIALHQYSDWNCYDTVYIPIWKMAAAIYKTGEFEGSYNPYPFEIPWHLDTED